MIERRWLRIFIGVHVLLTWRWCIDAQIRWWEGRFWATNKLWLTYAYAANFPVWKELVWDELTGERERGT